MNRDSGNRKLFPSASRLLLLELEHRRSDLGLCFAHFGMSLFNSHLTNWFAAVVDGLGRQDARWEPRFFVGVLIGGKSLQSSGVEYPR